MNRSEKEFLCILSCALKDKPCNIPDDSDYKEILAVSKRQQLSGIIAEKLFENEGFAKSEIFAEIKPFLIGSVMTQAKHTALFLSLYRRLNSNNIYPVVFKGIICRQLYGKYADYRPSSDEDIMVLPEEFGKTAEILEAEGYEQVNRVNEEELSRVQAISFINRKQSFTVEVHINPMGLDSEMHRIMDAHFHGVFSSYREENIDGVKIRTFTHTKHFLLLVFHALRHFTAGGMGIRQLTDILLYLEKYGSEIDMSYVENALRQVRSESFFTDMLIIGNKYLGFTDTVNGKENCPEALLEDFLSCGIFGNDTDAKIMAGTMTYMAAEEGEKSTSFIKTLFPDREYMSKENPGLENHPCMLPLAWIKRWGRFIKRSRGQKGSLALESLEISSRRIELLKKYGII